jgi:hypothetical protein
MGPRFDNYYAHADVITSLANHADHLTITVGNHSNEDDGELTEFVVEVADEVALEFHGDALRLSEGAENPFDPLVYSLLVTDDFLPTSITVGSDSIAGDSDLEMQFLNYGEPVTVDAPPAKDIIDIEEALAEIGADFEKG